MAGAQERVADTRDDSNPSAKVRAISASLSDKENIRSGPHCWLSEVAALSVSIILAWSWPPAAGRALLLRPKLGHRASV